MWDPIANLDLSNTLFPLMVVSASFLGSSHCTLMCGAISGLAGHTKKTALAYQLGRGLGYAILGAIAGSIGSGFETTLVTLWGKNFLPFFTVALSALMIHQAYQLLFEKRGPSKIGLFQNHFIQKFFGVKPKTQSMPPSQIQSFGIGALTLFMPCGWLYSFVLLAISSGSAISGAVILVSFWAGAIPALTLAPSLLRLGLKQKPSSQKIIATVLVLAAVINVASKVKTGLWVTPANESQDPAALQCH